MCVRRPISSEYNLIIFFSLGAGMEASTSQERILNLYLKNKGALVTSIDTYIFCNKNERINVHPCCNLVCLLVSFDDYTRNEFVSLIHA